MNSKVRVSYAFCCPGSPKYCDCVNKEHGTAIMSANGAGDDYPIVGGMGMQRYKSHKEVNAGKIAAIEVIENGVSKIALESGEVVVSSADWFRANTARRDEDELIGGYYVLYADGYDSWSPANAFEDGYVPVGD